MMFDKAIYLKRRNELQRKLKSGIVLLMGNEESGMNYADNTYRFRQDSSFLYYIGIDAPGLHAVINIDDDETILFGDDFSIDQIVWMGDMPTVKSLAEKSGIVKTAGNHQLKDYLSTKAEKLMYLPPYRPEHQLKLWNLLSISPEEAAAGASIPLIQAIALQRNTKSEDEIAEIEYAVTITAHMHRAAMRFALPGMTEAQVAAKVYETALAAGGDISFPIIATINGQTLHNHYHGNIISEGQLFLLDAGYETTRGYAGDMSSTFPVSSTFTTAQKDIYEIALTAHNEAIKALKPGINFKDIHLQTAAIIFDGLKNMGLTRGNIEDAVASGAHALFFPCGLGHLLGLDVHDMENLGEQWVGYGGRPKSTQFGLKSLRLGMELQAGNVLTIEPGIYFIPELINLWSKNKINAEFLNFDKIGQYIGFGGIRNEEDILITEDSYRILGEPLAKTIEEVEYERSFAFQK
jgi:Xaa-Pro aminopeptidase